MRLSPYLRALGFGGLCAVTLLAVAGDAGAADAQAVTFAGRSGDGVTLTAALYRPTQSGARPAVVALHGCGGNTRADGRLVARVPDWTDRWLAAGYAVLWPDSFGSRGLGSQCSVVDRKITPAIRAHDAEAAVAWLALQPGIDKARIALVGWSNGGGTALRAVSAAATWPDGDVRLAVAFYPGCRPLVEARKPWQARVPTTILMGAADDWTPPEPCRRLAASQPGQVRYIEYPGAFHDFDAPNLPVRQRRNLTYTAKGTGVAYVGTDPAARTAAIDEVTRLLADAFR